MARYWVGGTGNWSDATNHWATISGGAPGAGNLPTATDDVFFDSASNATGYTVTIDNAGGGAFCRDITFAAPATGNVTLAGSTVGLNVSGSFTLYSGMTNNFSAAISFLATSGTRTITCAGNSLLSTIVFNGSGATFQLADDVTIAGVRNLTRTAGTFDANGKTVSLTQTAHTLTGFTGSSAFYNLTRTATAVKTDTLTLGSNLEVSGTLTLSGNSAINRLLTRSDTRGTARTITAATVTVTNADFQDITGAGAGSWNLSAITGLSGDCGGNSGITFTTGATQYWFTATTGAKTWSDSANWYLGSGGTGGAGRVPLPQDSARFDSASIGAASTSISIDMPRLPGMDWTGVTNSPAMSKGFASSFFGSITWHSTLTWSGSAFGWTYEGRGSSVWTHSGMPSWTGGITVTAPGGTLTFGGAFTTAGTVLYSQGTLADGGYTITCDALSDSGSLTRALVASGNWIVTGQATNIIFLTPTGNSVTFSGTIRFTGTLTAARNFYFAGFTFGGIEFATSGAFANQIQTAPVVSGALHIDASVAARTILFTAGTTTTVASMTRDAGTNIVTLDTISGTGTFTLSKSGGGNIPSLHHMSITRSNGLPNTLTWYAGFGSTNGGTNTGWIFGTIPNQSTTATVASHSFVAKSGTTSSIFRSSATAAKFTFSALSGLTSSAITVPATVASFLFNGASATAKGIATVAAAAASFVYSAMAGVTSVVNPDPRVINVTVSVSPNPAIVVSRSSYSITVSR